MSQLIALAVRFDDLVRDSVVADFAELGRLGRVTRAHLTQIMNLLNLAPVVQGEILFLKRAERGREPITEKSLGAVVAVTECRKQRRMWMRQGESRCRVS